MTTLDYQVGASADDAFENTGGSMLVDLVQGNVDAATKFFGFRFQGVTIPAGATIDAAYLELYVYNANLDEPLHTIYGEDGANPAAFSTSNGDISARTATTAAAMWDNSDIGSTGFVQTPSLVSIVQELVDSYDYSSGAPLVFIVQGNADVTRDLGVMMYDGEPTQAAKLHIEYTAGGGGTTHDGAAALAGAGSLSGDGQRVLQAALAVSGAATLSSAAQRILQGASSLAGAATATAAGQRLLQAATALSGGGSMAAAGQRIVQGAIALAGSAALTAAGTVGNFVTAAAHLVGGATLTASGQRILQGVSSLSSSASLTAAGQRLLQVAASLPGAGAVAATGRTTLQAAVAIAGSATIAANGAVGGAITGIVHLTARARSFALSARARGFDLTARARTFVLTIRNKD